MDRVAELKQQLKPGKVYRREDLTKYSNAVDRHLAQLVDEGFLEKVALLVFWSLVWMAIPL